MAHPPPHTEPRPRSEVHPQNERGEAHDAERAEQPSLDGRHAESAGERSAAGSTYGDQNRQGYLRQQQRQEAGDHRAPAQDAFPGGASIEPQSGGVYGADGMRGSQGVDTGVNNAGDEALAQGGQFNEDFKRWRSNRSVSTAMPTAADSDEGKSTTSGTADTAEDVYKSGD